MSELKRRRWTADDLAVLRRLSFEKPLSAIAAALNRTVNAVRTKAAHQRLTLRDDLSRDSNDERSQAMSDGPSAVAPGRGDYVVLYQRQGLDGNPRLSLVRLSERATHTLIRATFESAVEAGPRFEQQARVMAAAAGTHGFRCLDELYTSIDDTDEGHDA
jgi:hypothetical protein